MPNHDNRRVMSTAEFDAIPASDKDPIDRYYGVLIDENERIDRRFFEKAEDLKELTVGQRMLIQLGTFDSQVTNGGITQFFWNRLEWIFDVADWIGLLEMPELQANYHRALESLVDKKDQWLAARQECARGGDSPDWETFRQTYELLDLGWFDDAYFDKEGFNERREWARLSRGLHHLLLTRMEEYIRTHRDEFIAV